MASSFFSDESGTSDVEARRVVSLPKASSPRKSRNGLFDDSDFEDTITLGSPTSPAFAVQSISPRRVPPGFFPESDAFGAEAFDTFAEVAETPEAPALAKASGRSAPKAKTLSASKAPAVTKARAARPKAEGPSSPASVPSSPARSVNSRTNSNSPAGRPRPGSLGSFSDSVRAKQVSRSPSQAKARAVSPASQAKARAASPANQAKARAASPANQAKARAASPANQAKARAASPANQAKARAASPASQAKARAASPASAKRWDSGSRSTTPKASASPRGATPNTRGAVAKVPPARIASKAPPKARPKSGTSLEVPDASRSPSPRPRSPGRPATSRSPDFPRSPSGSRPSSPSPRRPASPRSPPRSPTRASPKSSPLTRPGSQQPRTFAQRRTVLSPSSSESSPLKEQQLYREVQRKQKELDELKRRLEDEQVKAEKREDEVSSLQRRRQNTWEFQLDQQRHEWLPMLVEDERGRLLHQVSVALAQTRSSLSNGRVQVRKSLDQMQTENQDLQSQVGQLEKELQDERSLSSELRQVTETLKQKVVAIEKESVSISADMLRLQEQEELAHRSPLEEALQELQDTLQGERQKLLDAHEKMKLFQQEAAQNRIQLQESRKRLEDFELEMRRKLEEKEADLRAARAEGSGAADLAQRKRQELEEDLTILRDETKVLRRAAQDNRRLLLRSTFETWHSNCLQILLQRTEDLGQNNQEGLSRQLAVQEEKVKAAFTRASDLERDFASEKFACQSLREELREMRHKLDSEAIVQRSKAAAQEVLLETHRMERQSLEEQLAMVRCRSEETQEACAAREAMRCAEVQAQLFAQAEMSESRKEVAQLRAELAMSRAASEMSSVRSPAVWRSSVQEDSLTHALIHASMGSGRSPRRANGHGSDSVNSSWESIKVRTQRGDKYVTLLQSSSGAVASLLKQVRRLDDAHRTLSGGRNAVLAATPAQLRAVRALEKQTSMLERTNQEWTASIGLSLEDVDDGRQNINGFAAVGDDEVSASERGAAMVKMLRRTEGRLERLQERLQRLLTPPDVLT